MIRKIIVFLGLLFFCVASFAQYAGNNNTKQFLISGDTLVIDTLSLVPGSIKIVKANGVVVDSISYTLNYGEGLLILNSSQFRGESITISYKAFPYLFSAPLKHKDLNRIKPDLFAKNNPFSYTIESKSDDIFKMEGLSKTGSISRGISFGNNQDVVVNSNLNLQLSGHLNNNVDILLAATDNNIPIQADGTTQQLQEFDKVFIQLSNENSKLIAGDFQLMRPNSYFMNFYKKAQGLSFSTAIKTNPKAKNITEQGIYKTSLSAAVSRGKFARNQIQGVESNQGPYKLMGAENEPFIIVLSGTEKVYIDGRLLERGQENDYVINYNTAEVTFTPKQLITKDKRIVVEFQYSDKNYARSLVHYGNDFEKNNLKLHFNVYSEQDSKNQPLQQGLTTQQKQLLTDIGDTLSKAVSPSIDSVPFSNSEVLYQKRDTLVNAQFYSIYEYSTNSDSAHYRITFSNVGQGNGDYNQISSSANGKVFQWIAPVGGLKQGSYAPVVLLITPKKKQMITAGTDYTFSENSKLSIEGAMSTNDINTFSSINNNDNVGYGLKMNFDNSKPITGKQIADSTVNPIVVTTNVNYEYVQKTFAPIERYRSIEFDRDWNRKNVPTLSDQHIVGAAAGLSQKGVGVIGYKFNAFLEGSNYNANKQYVNVLLKKKGLNINYDGSLLNAKSITNSDFYRHKSGVSQQVSGVVIGWKDEFEHNVFSNATKDSLLANSYQFWEWQGYLQNADTTKNKYGLVYKQRNDFAVKMIPDVKQLNQCKSLIIHWFRVLSITSEYGKVW
jgi:hypothetical protein